MNGAIIQIATEKRRWCPVCPKNGRKSKLQHFQINFEEAILLCPDKECSYPLDSEPLEKLIIKRKAEDLVNTLRRKRRRVDSIHPANNVSEITSGGCDGLSMPDEILLRMGIKAANCDAGDSLKTANCDYGSVRRDIFGSLSLSTPQISIELEALNDVNSDRADSTKIPNHEIHSTVSVELEALNSGNYIDRSSPNHSSGSNPKVDAACNQESVNLPSFIKKEPDDKSRKNSVEKNCTPEDGENLKKESDNSKDGSDIAAPTEKSKPEVPKEVALKFLQWTNKESLCWLDVILSLLTHSRTLKMLSENCKDDSCLKQMVSSYGITQKIFRQGLELRRCELMCRMGRTVKLETSAGDVMVKTGGGNSPDLLFGAKSMQVIAMDELEGADVDNSFDVQNIFSREDPKTVSIEKMSQEANRLDELSKRMLCDVRESIFSSLEPSVRCRKGQNDSPLVALMSLLTKDPVGKDIALEYRWNLTCKACKSPHEDRVKREVVTFLRLPVDFKMSEPRFLRNCFNCKAPNQILSLNFDRLPDLFFHHFLEGIHPCRVSDLDFEFNGDKYAVTGLVQYKTEPDHFVSWLREPVADRWMECDDLKNCVCKYSDTGPVIPAAQVHIVMWEKQSPDSGYQLPAEKEPAEDGNVDVASVSAVKPNCPAPAAMQVPAVPLPFPIPVMTSLPAAASERSFNGKTPSPASAGSKDTNDSSRMTRWSLESCSRLERMRQKFELDKRRLSGQSCSRPVIPRIPVGIPPAEERSNKQNSRTGDLVCTNSVALNGKNISSETVFPDRISRTTCNKKSKSENEVSSRRKKCPPAPDHSAHQAVAMKTRSLLKVGCQSYLDAIMPLIKGKSISTVPKFEGYVLKSQKLAAASVECENGPKLPPNRKVKVCFSDTTVPNAKLQANISKPLETVNVQSRPPAKNGILAKVGSKSSLCSKLFIRDKNADENDLDFSLNFDEEDLKAVDSLLNNVSDFDLKILDDCSAAATSSRAENFDFDLANVIPLTSTASFDSDKLNVTLDSSSLCDLAIFENNVAGYPSEHLICGNDASDHPPKWLTELNGFPDCDRNEFSQIPVPSDPGSAVGNPSVPVSLTLVPNVAGYAATDASLVASSDSVLPDFDFIDCSGSVFPDLFEFPNIPLPVHSLGFECEWPENVF